MNSNQGSFEAPSPSYSSKCHRKMKRKTIRKLVHNICISYVSANGSV